MSGSVRHVMRHSLKLRAGRRGPDVCACGAFTLIEVLVVVAIIALLVAILIPSLQRAREQAKRSVCLSNLHQQGLGMNTYSHDHKGSLMLRGIYGYNLSETRNQHQSWGNTTTNKNTKVPINFGLLWGKYVSRNVDMFYCPSIWETTYKHPDRGAWSFQKNPPDTTFGGYMYAAPVATGSSPTLAGKDVYPKSVWHENYRTWVAKKPATPVWKAPICQAVQTDAVIGMGQFGGYIRATHQDGLNSLYADFHAKYVKDVDGVLRSKNPTSGPGGAQDLYDMWEIFGRRY